MKIVVAYNASADANSAVSWGAEIARATHAGLEIVHAVQLVSVPYAESRLIQELIAQAADQAHAMLESVASPLRERGLDVATWVRPWLTVETICERAEDLSADLIVMGQRGSSRATRLLIGTASSEVVRLAKTSVMVTRAASGRAHARHVVVAVDGSPNSVRAIRAARKFFPAASLTALYVTDGSESLTETVVRDSIAAAGESPNAMTIERRTGDPAPQINAALEISGCDAVVVGRRGLGLVREILLGSVSDRVLQFAPCPVVIVK